MPEDAVPGDGRVRRALVVVAHPDDADFAAAGTIATWTDAGTEVTYCIITDGDAGGFDESVPRADIPGIRRAEQRAAAKCAGVEDVRFLGYPDGELEVGLGLRRDVARVVRQVRPQRMLVQSPERAWGRVQADHPDHLAAGAAAMAAIYPDARNPFAHPALLADEGLAPWTVPETWIMAGPAPDRHVDVTGMFDRKLAALRAHRSQTAHMAELEEMLRGWMGRNARAGGMPDGRLAEAFRVVQTG